jgi:PAS domain S-box-containing protein
MIDREDILVPARPRVKLAGAIALVVGFLLAGGIFELEYLKRIVPGFVPMNPMTAAGFLLAAVSIAACFDRARRTKELARINATLRKGRDELEERVRKRTASLVESEGRLQAILDNTTAVVFLKDREGRYLLVNKQFEKLFGCSHEALQGKTAYDLFSKEIADRSWANDLKVLEKGVPLEFDEVAEHRDGPHTYISMKFPLLDAAGKPCAVCAISTDITERVRAEKALNEAKEEADQANRAKSEFLSRMSHELRTPLNAILGFAQLLQMDELTADQQEGVAHITRGGRHLLEVINEVLDLACIEAGRMSLSLEPVEVSEALQETIALLRPLAADRDVQLVTPLVCNSYVLADRQRLKQVLINLISNAIKYNRQGGAVRLACECDRDRVRISIEDTGVGIRPDQLQQLFTPFERLDAEHGAIEGTGLGLAVAKRLVEAMKGAIGVESAISKGSTFWINLPLTEAPLVRSKPADDILEASTAGSGEPSNVLHIEDNLSSFRLVERVLLCRPEIELFAARGGIEGLNIARERVPDLILLDLNLPQMDGYEVLEHLKSDQRCANIPVIIITADATRRQEDRFLAAGAIEYLTKPLNIKKFLEILDRTLAGRVRHSHMTS